MVGPPAFSPSTAFCRLSSAYCLHAACGFDANAPENCDRSNPGATWSSAVGEAGAKKAHAILEARIGRAVYHLWRKQVAFDGKKFLAS